MIINCSPHQSNEKKTCFFFVFITISEESSILNEKKWRYIFSLHNRWDSMTLFNEFYKRQEFVDQEKKSFFEIWIKGSWKFRNWNSIICYIHKNLQIGPQSPPKFELGRSNSNLRPFSIQISTIPTNFSNGEKSCRWFKKSPSSFRESCCQKHRNLKK